MLRSVMDGLVDDELLWGVLDPPAPWSSTDGQHAAVLALLVLKGEEDHVLFTRRRPDLPHHPAQVSFPGGRREGEEDPVVCALRETEEELGIPPPRVRVLGAMPPRQSSTGFQVHPLIGRLEAGVPLLPDPAEVDEVLEVPWTELRTPGRWTVARPPAGHRPSPHFQWGRDVVWGLTGRLMVDLLVRVHPREFTDLAR